MKNAANCDTSCELQNSVNHQNFERTRRSWVFLRARSLQCRLAPNSAAFFSSSFRGGGEERQFRKMSVSLVQKRVAWNTDWDVWTLLPFWNSLFGNWVVTGSGREWTIDSIFLFRTSLIQLGRVWRGEKIQAFASNLLNSRQPTSLHLAIGVMAPGEKNFPHK